MKLKKKNQQLVTFILTSPISMQATTIIRSKPKDISAKEYAQQLAIKLRSSETSWKSKVCASMDLH